MDVVLRLPEVTQYDAHMEMVGFRVRGKGFCYLQEADETVRVKTTLDERTALIAEDPETFSPFWEGGRFAWVEVRLATVDPAELAELVTEGWRMTAPKRLAKELEAPPAL